MILCAGYESANQGSCNGDSGGPLMVFNTKSSQFFQVGLVSGGVSDCGDKYTPSYYTMLDHPEIADFIQFPENFISRGIKFSISFLYII
jgi:secreted trypsin-like serine protease